MHHHDRFESSLDIVNRRREYEIYRALYAVGAIKHLKGTRGLIADIG